MKWQKMSLLTIAVVMSLGNGSVMADRSLVEQISQFGVKYQVTDNLAASHGVNCAMLGADFASCNRATITLTNNGPAITRRDWAIYMSNVHKTLAVENDQFRMVHIVGDLTRLEPTEKFRGISAGASITIPIINEYWQLFSTDVMPRWYVTSGDAQPKIISVTDTDDLNNFVVPLGEHWKRIAEDKNILMMPASRFEKNSDIALLPASALRGQILPTPLKVNVLPEDADLSQGVSLNLTTLSSNQAEAVAQRFKLLGVPLNAAGYPVTTRIDATKFDNHSPKSGEYTLSISQEKAEIVGYDAQGCFMVYSRFSPCCLPMAATRLRRWKLLMRRGLTIAVFSSMLGAIFTVRPLFCECWTSLLPGRLTFFIFISPMTKDGVLRFQACRS